ncbi:hypothetical protein DM860_016358 [Cuscuta australis]|uniref:Uncharacterized protein n=1 Tax=Cuscuta australis TaxID=267555 RepID=A0A328DDJ6_9ASTE|nr:hypothetical protein DM860_016358 [Cuscuta australis]
MATEGGFVVFFSSRRKLESKPPFLAPDVESSSTIFTAFHVHDAIPILVIIDDFADFFDDRYCLLSPFHYSLVPVLLVASARWKICWPAAKPGPAKAHTNSWNL